MFINFFKNIIYNFYYSSYIKENDYLIYSKTDNGANALETTNNIFLDLFINLNRDLSNDKLFSYMNNCMIENPYKTIAIIFNSRDRKNGKKEKRISNIAIYWIKKYWPKTYIKNIENYINKYGCWKDLLYITKNYVNIEDFEIELFAKQLINDKKLLINNNDNISLCAKWAPSEKKKYDKRNNISQKIASKIFQILNNNHELTFDISNKYTDKFCEFYRKEYLSPLRNKINITEKLMCSNNWNNINYENVPAIASKKYKNCFIKHDSERYTSYLNNVMQGKQKINVTGILPHELVNYYLINSNIETNDTIESQWKTILNNMQKTELFHNLISVVDVSGSMFNAKNGSIPAQVAIALGLLISNCNTGLYKNKIITFDSTPSFHNIEGNTLKEQVECIKNAKWGYNTNFELVADLIISYGKINNLNNNELPQKLIVLSDMQFDESIDNDYLSTISNQSNYNNNNKLELLYNIFCNKFITNNYNPPKLIYWNLNSDNTNSFPVSSKIENTAIISGFSEQLLKIFMEYDDFNPDIVLDKILDKYINDVIVDNDELVLFSNYKVKT